MPLKKKLSPDRAKTKRVPLPTDKSTHADLTPLKFTALNGKEYTLTVKQRLFCELYLESMGDRYNSVIEAGYDIYDKRGNVKPNAVRKQASENLTKPFILEFLKTKYSEYGFTDENVMKEHLTLINQQADLGAKAKGIDMYYKVKGQYAEDKNDAKAVDFVTDLLKRASKLLPD